MSPELTEVVINGDLTIGGKDSVYEISDTSRLNVRGNVNLLAGTNAFFHQRGGTVLIGSTFDANGHSSNGLLDLGGGTTYQMDGGTLDVATIRQTGQFVFNGGMLHVKQMLINNVAVPAPIISPATPAEAVSPGGYVPPTGGFTLERGIVVLDENSDWQLTGSTADLTIGHNADGGSNGSLVQNGGNIQVEGSLIIGDGPGGKGNYAMSVGTLTVHGQMILGRNGGIGYFNQTGGSVTIDGSITITESTTGASKFDITGGTLHALDMNIGANGGPGELHIGNNASVRVTQDLVIGPLGRVTGSGTFDLGGAKVINNGVISPGNSPGLLQFHGNYVQGSSGMMHMQFAADTNPGVGYDQLVIDGNLNLAGTLELEFIEGYAPKAGLNYSLIQLTPGHSLLNDLSVLTATVDGLAPGWQYSLVYDSQNNEVVLHSINDGVAVPEPSTMILLALAGLAMTVVYLRRQ